jgi:hypothetical protein
MIFQAYFQVHRGCFSRDAFKHLNKLEVEVVDASTSADEHRSSIDECLSSYSEGCVHQ